MLVYHEGKNIVMENLNKRVLRGVFVPEGDEVTGSWGSYVLKSSISCTFTKYSYVHQPRAGGRKV
jgi:hypothetical protein